MIKTPDSNELQPIVPISGNESETQTDQALDAKLYKSLSYLTNFEFIEKDRDGIKMRVKRDFLGGEFPFEVGYVLTSEYDDRRFLISKIDLENNFLWFGLWEE